MEIEQMYNHNLTPAPFPWKNANNCTQHTIYWPSAKNQTALRLLTWVYSSHYLLYCNPRQDLKMIIIYNNYYMLQPDTSLSRFANQPNRVWSTWARHLAVSHLQVSAVNIKANFAIQLKQTSIQQPEAHRSSYSRTGRHLCTFPVTQSKLQWASTIFRISELH